MSDIRDLTHVDQSKMTVDSNMFLYGGDHWKLICKASKTFSDGSPHWMKSTKALEIPHAGCIVQTTTEIYGAVVDDAGATSNHYAAPSIVDALVFVPAVRIEETDGVRTLVSIAAMPPSGGRMALNGAEIEAAMDAAIAEHDLESGSEAEDDEDLDAPLDIPVTIDEDKKRGLIYGTLSSLKKHGKLTLRGIRDEAARHDAIAARHQANSTAPKRLG